MVRTVSMVSMVRMAPVTRAALAAFVVLWMLPCAPGHAAPSHADPAAAAALARLADAEWEWRLAQFPEMSTIVGEHRYDDRLTDLSVAAVAARRGHHKELLSRLHGIDRASLAGEDATTWDILEFGADNAVREDELLMSQAGGGDPPWAAFDDTNRRTTDSPLGVNQMAGPQLSWPQLVRATRFGSVDDYRHYLARLKALPLQLQQIRAQLDAGRKAGWMPPKVAVQRLPGQFGPLVGAELGDNPLFAPFKSFAPAVSEIDRAALAQEAEATLHEAVVPAFQAFREYLDKTWVPAATTTLAAAKLPHGDAYYALALRRFTTSSMSPAEIHALGLREVARIDEAMQAAMKESGFTGTMGEFRAFLRTDPQFQFRSAAEELVAFRDIAKRVDPLLPRLFAELPRLPYGIRAMSPEEGNNAPHYIRGAIDGSRAGYFEANVNNLAAWPRWTMDSLFLHEAVPGHHLQVARAQELTSLPAIRRAYSNSGYAEGWALYAEGLGKELDLYADPYTRFGRLAQEQLRAARLVVDTGLHTMGWTREQAIDYLIAHAQLERGFAEAEIDRYLVWPGQATAYKLGELAILSLREKARAALGERFDIRRFHNAVIDHGTLPLTVLERVMGEWIESERRATRH